MESRSVHKSFLNLIDRRIVGKIPNNFQRERNRRPHATAGDDITVHNHFLLADIRTREFILKSRLP